MSTDENPLHAWRQAHALDLGRAASQVGVNKTTWLRWETGRVPAERAAEVEKVTGVPRHVLRPDLWEPPPGARKGRGR